MTILSVVFFKVIISPALLRFNSPSEATCTIAPPKSPVGVPPPKRTNTPFAGITVDAGKVCLKAVASEIVNPLISNGELNC